MKIWHKLSFLHIILCNRILDNWLLKVNWSQTKQKLTDLHKTRRNKALWHVALKFTDRCSSNAWKTRTNEWDKWASIQGCKYNLCCNFIQFYIRFNGIPNNFLSSLKPQSIEKLSKVLPRFWEKLSMLPKEEIRINNFSLQREKHSIERSKWER